MGCRWRRGSLLLAKPMYQQYLPSSPFSSRVVDMQNHRQKSSKPAHKSSSPAPPVSDPIHPDASLLKSLTKELKKSSAIIQKYQIAIKGSFEPFELVPNVGTSDLTLRRQMGDEEILVKCLMHLESLEDEGSQSKDDFDALKSQQRLNLNVRISKVSSQDGPRVAFLCSYMSHSIVIEDVAYLDKPLTADDYPYSGPYFGDLNPKFQEAFHNVLKARGIDPSLADLIMDHLSSKYQAEYTVWLQKIQKFLKQ